jgi:aminoacrylate peracid reductase
MPILPVIPPASPPPLAPYSPGMRAGDWLFVSGTLALGPKGEVVGAGDVAAQTRDVLNSIKAVVEAAGGTMASVVYTQIFPKDLADYGAMNKAYAEFFPARPPARYCIRADLVKPEFLVEIASTAYLGR